MSGIIQVTGKVKFPITIDPGVWIFDERKVNLDTYFSQDQQKIDLSEKYKQSVSRQWDKEITEGAQLPEKPTAKLKKTEILEGTFGMELAPFLKTAEPHADAHSLVILADGKEYSFPLEEATTLIAGFSNKGKPLREDGPIHIYKGDGSNRDNPIKNVTAFKII
ncbi:hypothetical protein A8F94_11895 [Bacillus sp. FJAT-27225]|uniref:hypothetical protein n=1 Tax=Bacillus sp. FJAT-27225 TaxID=1743144 RepID=UPI00080C33AB|nr:hypothetical protein [Bacillus sp. FJAT-27225]OCA85581.1 hypothetical protein A8F94_11895 [Bacillus sp. FJAT-27225]